LGKALIYTKSFLLGVAVPGLLIYGWFHFTAPVLMLCFEFGVVWIDFLSIYTLVKSVFFWALYTGVHGLSFWLTTLP
jgi:hypothetical protein